MKQSEDIAMHWVSKTDLTPKRKRHLLCSAAGEERRIKNTMLFHNRPVRAAMGSVIANGGVQLSNDESLIRAE